MKYTVSYFFCDLSVILDQTFKSYTIQNAFKESGMFPASYKSALKQMLHYNAKKKATYTQPSNPVIASVSSGKGSNILILEEGGDLELPVLPSIYFQYQKEMGERVDKADGFSPISKNQFQQLAKGMKIYLTEVQL